METDHNMKNSLCYIVLFIVLFKSLSLGQNKIKDEFQEVDFNKLLKDKIILKFSNDQLNVHEEFLFYRQVNNLILIKKRKEFTDSSQKMFLLSYKKYKHILDEVNMLMKSKIPRHNVLSESSKKRLAKEPFITILKDKNYSWKLTLYEKGKPVKIFDWDLKKSLIGDNRNKLLSFVDLLHENFITVPVYKLK